MLTKTKQGYYKIGKPIYEETTQEMKESSTSMFKGDDYYDRMAQDPTAMREIELYIENDGDLYRQQFMPIIQNIQRKMKSGKYDHSLSPKLWGYLVENGMKKYGKEFGDRWNTLLSTKDRKILAQKLADAYYDEIMLGNYD